MSLREPRPFDFASLLLHHTGVEHWDIEELVGGETNHTVRVRRIQGIGGKDKPEFESDRRYSEVLSAHSSVIFKQAPAFLAKFPEVPFSPYRQTIEAKALELLHASVHEHPFGLSPVLAKNPTIDIPQLLLQDTSVEIIIQTDLGSLPTLDRFLTSPTVSPHLASQLGQSLGQFLADLHHAFDTSSASPFSPTSDLMQTFRNDDVDRVIETIVDKATGHMRDAGISDSEILRRRALDHWNTRKKSAFGQGDIWFATLLVNDRASTKWDEVSGIPTIGICDWEFAGPNHPAADIAQLGAYLHLASLSPLTTPDLQSVLRAFALSLYSTYYSTSPILDPASHSEFLRSLVIMHGWELINAAGWSSRQYLWCNCPGEGVRCSHVAGMVKEGAQLLRAAGELDDDCGVDREALKNIAWCKYFPLYWNDCTGITG